MIEATREKGPTKTRKSFLFYEKKEWRFSFLKNIPSFYDNILKGVPKFYLTISLSVFFSLKKNTILSISLSFSLSIYLCKNLELSCAGSCGYFSGEKIGTPMEQQLTRMAPGTTPDLSKYASINDANCQSNQS